MPRHNRGSQPMQSGDLGARKVFLMGFAKTFRISKVLIKIKISEIKREILAKT